MKDYTTRRGALLASMEHNCEQPGLWLVEGFQVRRIPSNRWLVVGLPERFTSFEDALEAVAAKVHS